MQWVNNEPPGDKGLIARVWISCSPRDGALVECLDRDGMVVAFSGAGSRRVSRPL